MAKYIIEIEDDPFGSIESSDMLWRAKGFKSLVFDKNGLEKLTPYKEQSTSSCWLKVGDIIRDGCCEGSGVIARITEGKDNNIRYKVFWTDGSVTSESDHSLEYAHVIGFAEDVEKTITEWVRLNLRGGC